jgi:hypothetical protein
MGLKIKRERYALAREGARMFGILDLTGGDKGSEYGMAVGVRNSHDKSFPAALSLGTRVFVCDNLAFSGEVRLERKHTRFIMRDLPGLVTRAVGALVEMRGAQDRRIERYQGVRIMDDEAHDLVIRALDAGAVTTTAIPAVLSAWRKPLHEAFASRNAWSLFNAFTEVGKAWAPALVMERTLKLHGLFDGLCGLARAENN